MSGFGSKLVHALGAPLKAGRLASAWRGLAFGTISAQDAASYQAVLDQMTPVFRAIEEMPDEKPAVRYARTPGYRPGHER